MPLDARTLTTTGVQMTADRASTICVLVNGGSGKQKGANAANRIAAAFRATGRPYVLRRIRRGATIEAQARQALAEGFRTLVAAGGDGTICAVASAVAAEPEARLGVISLGTFNYFSRSLGLPDEIEAAVEVIVQGHERPLNIGSVNGRIFLNNASLGAYPAILETREGVYRSFGRSRVAAYWSVVIALIRRRGHFEAEVHRNGEIRSVKAAMIMCVSNPFQLAEMDLGGVEAARKGELVMLIAPQRGPLQMLGMAFGLLRGKLRRHQDYDLVTGTEFLIQPRRPRQKVARDGEWHRERGPFRFRMVPQALRVIVPADADATGGPGSA